MSDISFVKQSTPSNADTGEKKLYFTVGGALASIDEAGVIQTYSTGITAEEVQDIVGGLITSSGSIQVTYNDVANLMQLDLIQSAVDHTQISNRGTNTHVQIDSHIANTSNPHGVTKAQVGLGSCDNTSDANKPISTATQLALDAKYNASNPNGYETPTQLNTRDTNNRARVNHTGTQTASTISDFNSSVRSTDLTGISFADETDVVATDTILQAIGKLQAKSNAILAWDEKCTTVEQSTSSSVTFVNLTELSGSVLAGKKYYIEVTLRFKSSAGGNGIRLSYGSPDTADGLFAMMVNAPVGNDGTGSLYSGQITSLVSDIVVTTGVQATNTYFIISMKGSFICTVSGTILPQFCAENSGQTIFVGAGSFVLIREF